MLDGLENTHSRAKTEVGAIEHALVSAERYHATAYLHVVSAQFDKFLCQDFLKSLKRLGNEFKIFH